MLEEIEFEIPDDPIEFLRKFSSSPPNECVFLDQNLLYILIQFVDVEGQAKLRCLNK